MLSINTIYIYRYIVLTYIYIYVSLSQRESTEGWSLPPTNKNNTLKLQQQTEKRAHTDLIYIKDGTN